MNLCLGNYYIEDWAYQENLITKYFFILGHDVSIIASCDSFDEKNQISNILKPGSYINKNNIKVTRVSYKYDNFIIRKLKIFDFVFEELVRENPDIIFVHGLQFLDIFKVIRYKKKNMKVKIIVDNHADYINSATNWISKNILHRIIWGWCARSLEPYVEKFYGVTPLRCKFLEEMYKVSPRKIELLVMGADDEKINLNSKSVIRTNLRNKYGIEQDDFLIITGGKIDRSKNIHLLIKAVNKIKNEHIKLLIFGTPSPDMKDEIELISKYEKIINIGWINGDDVYDYFLAADLAIFPGTHSVLWEQAAGCGIPCIFKYWEGMTHVDVGGNCLFLYEDSVKEISKLIKTINDDKQLYKMMKKVAEEKAVKFFSYTDIAKRAIDV